MDSNIDILRDYGDWRIGSTKNITFIVTEDCQLRCKYCYVVNKSSFGKITFTTAKQVIDYILKKRDVFYQSSVVWDFIGGEPLLEIELIDCICDYIKKRTYELQHPWFDCYRINLTTNGILYDNPLVQKFIKKNSLHLDISITLDGTKEKHDANRIYASGKGSFSDVLKNIPLWVSQFNNANTKSTIAHSDIPYIKESVLFLWDIGIKHVNINVVYEDVWIEGDDILFEDQLKQLADVMIEKELYNKYYCSFFDENIGHPLNIRYYNDNWCGAGYMLAVDSKGNFFPCLRFASYSLSNKKELCIGNYNLGIVEDKLRPFCSIDRASQSAEECINCEVASGCAWCQAGNYDNADTDTIFQRATYSCLMHKARVRANKYFWEKIAIKKRRNGIG